MLTRLSYLIDSAEPVTLDEAKLAARVDGNDLDALIQGLIAAARVAAEDITGRYYRGLAVRVELADWPAADCPLPVFGASTCEASYWDGADWTALDGALYMFAPGSIAGAGTAVAPVVGGSWPTLVERPVGPRVRFDLTAGPASNESVPDTVKLFIKASVATWLDQGAALVSKDLLPNPLHERLLDGERLWF